MSPTGHLSIGFAAKKYAPKIPVFLLLIAAYAIDFIYFLFLSLGMDTFDYNPWSHSLLMAIIWSIFAAILASFFFRKLQSGCVIGLVVFSHWVLDFIVWDNLPVFFEKTHRIGLGLYNNIGFTLTGITLNSGTIIATSIELGMLLLGVLLYIRFRRESLK